MGERTSYCPSETPQSRGIGPQRTGSIKKKLEPFRLSPAPKPKRRAKVPGQRKKQVRTVSGGQTPPATSVRHGPNLRGNRAVVQKKKKKTGEETEMPRGYQDFEKTKGHSLPKKKAETSKGERQLKLTKKKRSRKANAKNVRRFGLKKKKKRGRGTHRVSIRAKRTPKSSKTERSNGA